MTDDVRTLELSDGTALQYFVDEDAPGAGLLVFHHGTPAAGPLDPEIRQAARANDLMLVELVRPGYGGSSRRPGRTVADVVPLVADLADHLGHERFVTMGWSGGGPHAIATAALLPDRCAAAICLASVAPFDAEGLDFLAGMGQDNLDEFGAAACGAADLEDHLSAAAADLADVTGPQVVDALASLLPDVDRAYLTGESAERTAESLRWSVSTGIWGWFDDDIAFVAPWGFDLESVRVPITVMQGSADLMVPFAHGRWLAGRIPSATARLVDGRGHLSLVHELPDAMAELRARLEH